MRRAGASACSGDYAASLGKVALSVTKLTGRVASLTCLATVKGLDLYTLDFFEATVRGSGSASEEFHNVTDNKELTSCRMRSQGGDASCVTEKVAVLQVRNVDCPCG